MLANFFSKSKPINYIVLLALFLVFFVFSAFSKELSFDLVYEFGWFLIIFSVYNFILIKNNLTFDNTYAFLFFVLLIGFFPDTIAINKTFYANLTLLLYVRKVYSLQRKKNVLKKLFDAGFWLGVSFLIEPYAPLLLVLLYIAIYLHQRFTYQTITAPLIGFLCPVILFFTYHFWFDNLEKFWLLFNWSFYPDLRFYSHEKSLFSIVFIGVFLAASTLMKSPKTLAVKNTFRKNWILILTHLAIVTIILLLVVDGSGSEFLYGFFPISVILANGIELVQKKWYAFATIVLFFIASVTVSILV